MYRGWGDRQRKLGFRTSKLCLRAPMHWASHPGIARAGQSLHKGRSDRQKELGNRTSGLALSDQQTARHACPTGHSLLVLLPGSLLFVIPTSVQLLAQPSSFRAKPLLFVSYNSEQ